ncbi:MAG: hypothetical protein MUP22_04590 [Desulfobacterales bacterium]|nr:hypothetical protein [Desulfobacterales bacterium]
MNRYHEIEKQLFEHTSGLPIYIESFDENNVLKGDVFSIISHPFSSVSNALIDPTNWCDISLLHLNIKACTFKKEENTQKLTIYSGRKFYQPPEDALVLEYQFQVLDNQPNYFKILLTADSGPMDTSDYRIELEAIPLKGKKTFTRFSYTYKYGIVAQTAMEGYLTTLGRNKIGFSIIGQDENNDPVYINGTRGAIERNSVRYYFAIQAYLDTLKLPEKNRFEQRIQLWYSFTDRFKNQLYELPREDYISSKKLEYQNQLKLQDRSKHDLK